MIRHITWLYFDIDIFRQFWWPLAALTRHFIIINFIIPLLHIRLISRFDDGMLVFLNPPPPPLANTLSKQRFLKIQVNLLVETVRSDGIVDKIRVVHRLAHVHHPKKTSKKC